MNYPQNPNNSIKRSVTSSFHGMLSPWKHATASCALSTQTQNNPDFLNSGNKLQDLYASRLNFSSRKTPQRSESMPLFSLNQFIGNIPQVFNVVNFLDNSPETVMANSIRLRDVSTCISTPSLVEQITSSGLSVHCANVPLEVIRLCSSEEKGKEDDSMSKVQLTPDKMNGNLNVENLISKHVILTEDEMEIDDDVVFTSSSGDEEEEDKEEDSDEEITDEEEDSDEMSDEEEDDDDDDDWNIGDDRYIGKESSCTNQDIKKSTAVSYFVANSFSIDWSSGIDEEINSLPVLNNCDMQLGSDDEDDFDSLICEVNKKWESFYSKATQRTETKSKQVSFAREDSLVTLHCWEDMEDSRKGLWNVDAQRFRRRIDECGKVLSQILQTDHRKKVFSSLDCFKEARS